MENIKTFYEVVSWDRYSQREDKTIFFATGPQAYNYVEFMKENDPDTIAGYISYEIKKQTVYLSEDVIIIRWLKQNIRNSEDNLEKLKDEDGNIPAWGVDLQQYKKYEKRLKDYEELLKSYQEKLLSKNNEGNSMK